MPPDPEPNPVLNRNCLLNLKIINVSTFKDHDTFGKQDPYVKFKYDNEFQQTRVAEDAGTEATFNENFELRRIMDPINGGDVLTLEAYDKDVLTSDLMGQANPISFSKVT